MVKFYLNNLHGGNFLARIVDPLWNILLILSRVQFAEISELLVTVISLYESILLKNAISTCLPISIVGVLLFLSFLTYKSQAAMWICSLQMCLSWRRTR